MEKEQAEQIQNLLNEDGRFGEVLLFEEKNKANDQVEDDTYLHVQRGKWRWSGDGNSTAPSVLERKLVVFARLIDKLISHNN